MMTPKIKIVKLTKGTKVGTKVPKQNLGNVGYAIEDKLSANYSMNSGPGLDMQEIGLEVKTRKTSAQSANTVGSMIYEKIKNTSYKDSAIFNKIQQQYRVEYDDEFFHEVTSEKVYDFRDPYIQKQIEEGYESARAKMINGCTANYIRGFGIGYFEKKRGVGDDTKSYDFRITGSQMKHIETIANSASNFKKLFT